jgi:hypothetical protein
MEKTKENNGRKKEMNKQRGITLIALVITIIVLLILAGISIATLTGENGILNKTNKAKEEHLIEQYKEEINLIIIDEIAERKTQRKEERMIISLDKKIREKEWVNEIYKCNSSGEEQPTFEESTHLLVESKEHYEFLIEVDEAKQTAKIVDFGKDTGEKYTVTYHPNGGEGQAETIEIKQGTTLTLKECNYIRKGYTFLEWNTQAEGTGNGYESGANISIKEDMILYAVWKAPSTVEEAKEAGVILNSEQPTTITDTYGNEVRVPEGFKIAEDSATNATEGIVIEDVSHEATAGSQFVWIPVGTVYTNAQKTTSETITLNRYTFDDNGNSTAQGEKVIDSYYQELATSNKGNIVAKNIQAFKTSATTNKGYYMGRYEARSVTQRTSEANELGQVTTKPNDYVYNYVTQQQAATLAREMYETNNKFTSDLVNSYAWDTAIVFLQTFDNRSNKTKPYSKQNSLNTTLAPRGTNNLSNTARQDKICNVWDMASNNFSWTTETSLMSGAPAPVRGGTVFLDAYCTSSRDYDNIDYANNYCSFRTILYL